ncbi:hypothetical protein JOQ06_012324, partial [Pogonophryne albipinna]
VLTFRKLWTEMLLKRGRQGMPQQMLQWKCSVAESLASILPPLSLPVLSSSQGTPTLSLAGLGGAASEWG